MMGGIVGDMIGGQHVFDSIIASLPVDELTTTDYTPLVVGGSSVTLPADSLTTTDYTALVTFLTVARLPVDEITVTDYPASVVGGSSVALPVDSLTFTDYEPTIAKIIRGIPKFTVSRSATSATINITNRESRTVALYRASDYNQVFSLVDTYDTDEITDSGLTSGVRYKYLVQFVATVGGSIDSKGIKSKSKYTK